jgi:hypothetical protein
MAYWIVRLLRVVSMIACLIVVASFTIFVVHQSSSASQHQQEVVRSGGGSTAPASGSHVGGVHRVIDEASNELTSPFAGIVSSSSSEWGSRLVGLVLSLLVYGLGLGYVMRVISVRGMVGR